MHGVVSTRLDQPPHFMTSPHRVGLKMRLNHSKEKPTTPRENPETRKSRMDVAFVFQESRREGEQRNVIETKGCEQMAVPMNRTCVVVLFVDAREVPCLQKDERRCLLRGNPLAGSLRFREFASRQTKNSSSRERREGGNTQKKFQLFFLS